MIEKILKRSLKKKRRITKALIVNFLITGCITFSAERNSNKNEKILNTTQNISSDYTNNGTIGVNDSNGIKTQNATIINNGIIKSSENKNIQDNYAGEGNGISNYNENPNISIKNSGYIQTDGKYKDDIEYLHAHAISNGISLAATSKMELKSLENTGAIMANVESVSGLATANDFASAYLNGAGNGISVYGGEATIGNQSNTGRVEGKAKVKGGEAQNYVADGNLLLSGNGLAYGVHNLKVGNLINKGKFKGIGDSTGGASSGASAAANLQYSGNGAIIYGNNELTIETITNNGIMQGSATGVGDNKYDSCSKSGNGLVVNGYSSTSNYDYKYFNSTIENSGSILGYAKIENTNATYYESGSGLVLQGLTGGSVINKGSIIGNQSSLNIINDGTGTINNYGILAGKSILTLENVEQQIDNKKITGVNQGIFVILNDDQSVNKIINGSGNNNIVNADISKNDSSKNYSSLTLKDSVVINGAGVSKGALVIDKQNATLSNAIVNGYQTALYIENGNSFTGTNVTFNGGGVKGDIAVIKGDGNNNSVTLNSNSIINGITDLGDGDDHLTLDNSTQINGDLDGNNGSADILDLGNKIVTKAGENLNIFYDIKGFETVNTNGDVTLYETSKVTGATTINLNSGNLNLRVDPTQKDNQNKIIGHALYGNTGTVNTNGGNLVIGLNGIDKDAVISMGSTTITNSVNDSWWKDTDHLTTNSLVLDAKLENNGKDIKVTVKESIPLGPSKPVEKPPVVQPPVVQPPVVQPPVVQPPVVQPPEEKPGELEKPVNPPEEKPVNPPEEKPVNPPEIDSKPEQPSIVEPDNPTVEESNGTHEEIKIDNLLYEKLNKIYQSIVSSNEIDKLEKTTSLDDKTYNESLGELLTILNRIYANTPYAYTLKSSRDGMKLFNDHMSYLTIKPKQGEYIAQGKAIYTGVQNDNGNSGKNYYGFDIGKNSYKTTTNTIGGIATLEYGLTDKTSVGFVVGGNNQDINFKGSSKIKANSLYIGSFGKTEIDDFKFFGGIGYQYTDAKATRVASNRYNRFETGDHYNINGISAFLEGKYVYKLNNDLRLEPKLKLSYYNIKQSEVNEGYDRNQLSIKANGEVANTTDLEIGVDLVKEYQTATGKLRSILTLGVINTLGDKEESLDGYILGENGSIGSQFEIQGVKIPTTTGKIGLNLEYEKINGMIYTIGSEYQFAENSNANISVQLGVGYKF